MNKEGFFFWKHYDYKRSHIGHVFDLKIKLIHTEFRTMNVLKNINKHNHCKGYLSLSLKKFQRLIKEKALTTIEDIIN